MRMEDEGEFPSSVYLLYRNEVDGSDERLIGCFPNYADAVRSRDLVAEEWEIAVESLEIAVQGVGEIQWAEGYITLWD